MITFKGYSIDEHMTAYDKFIINKAFTIYIGGIGLKLIILVILINRIIPI